MDVDADKGDGSSEGVRSLERGLALLRALNEEPRASVAALSRRLDVPRSSIYRLLATLEHLGYVGRTPGATGYRLKHAVRNLSEGYLDDDWLEAVWPELVDTGEKIIWPLSLFTFDVNSMVIRLTTHDRSTLSIDYAMTGRRMPMTETSAGIAYLAFCPAEERAWLLAQSQISRQLEQPIAHELLMRQLAGAVENGYAVRVGGLMPKTSSLSAPVLIGPRVLCCISVIWISSALGIDQAIAKLAAPMQALAAKVARIAAEQVNQDNSGRPLDVHPVGRRGDGP